MKNAGVMQWYFQERTTNLQDKELPIANLVGPEGSFLIMPATATRNVIMYEHYKGDDMSQVIIAKIEPANSYSRYANRASLRQAERQREMGIISRANPLNKQI